MQQRWVAPSRRQLRATLPWHFARRLPSRVRQLDCDRHVRPIPDNGQHTTHRSFRFIIPEADVAALKTAGIAEIFLPGTSTQDIVDFIHKRVTH